jgi:hypothetical protein
MGHDWAWAAPRLGPATSIIGAAGIVPARRLIESAGPAVYRGLIAPLRLMRRPGQFSTFTG